MIMRVKSIDKTFVCPDRKNARNSEKILFGFIDKNLSADQKIGISAVILLFAAFLSSSLQSLWNALGFPGTAIIKYLIYAICILLALPGMISAFNRNFKPLVSSAAAFSVLIFLTAYFNPRVDTAVLLKTELTFFIYGLTPCILVFSMKSLDVLWDVLLGCRYYIFIAGLIYYLADLYRKSDYSLPFGYSIALIALVFIINALKSKNIADLLFFIISFFFILDGGSRGSLLALLIGIMILFFLYLFSNSFKSKFKKNHWFIFIVLTFGFIAALFVFLEPILNALGDIIGAGKQSLSRTLKMFASGNIGLSSGRDEIYGTIINDITLEPFAIRGIYSAGAANAEFQHLPDMSGFYSHNIVLELTHNFGIIIGPVIFIILCFIIIRAFIKKKSSKESYLAAIFTAIGFLPLFISGLLWTSCPFWILIGIGLNQIAKSCRKRRKGNKNEIQI